MMKLRTASRSTGLLLLVLGCGTAKPSATKVEGPASTPRSPGALTCEEFLAKEKLATGGAAWDPVAMIRQEGRLRSGGLQGRVTSYEDTTTGRSYNAYELGPLAGTEGFDGRVSWSRDQDGSVNVSESQSVQESAVNEAFRTARARWYRQRWPAEVQCGEMVSEGSRRFHVLEFHPKGGSRFRIWIDAETWLIDRAVEPQAVDTTTTFFSDYREVDGLRIPYAIRTSTGDDKYDQLVELEQVEINPEFDQQKFRVPAEEITDFTIAGDQHEAAIPFELVNNHIYVQAMVNGQGPFNLLVDTGGANILTPTALGALKVDSRGELRGRGAGEETVDTGLAKIDKLALGDVELEHQVFYIVPLEKMEEAEGVPFHGLVGYEVFKRFAVTIDYADRKLVLRRPESFVYRGSGTPVPFVFDSHIPVVSGSIDGIAGVFKVDTGNRGALSLYGPFAEEHRLIEKYRPKVETLTGWGVGGGVRGWVFRAGELVLGEVHIAGPVSDLFSGTRGSGTNKNLAGNVGGGVLKRFTVTFDYRNKLIYLEPNRNHGQLGNWDRSGMWINREGDSFTIKDVVPGGPAEQAGLHVEDVILAIDGTKVEQLSLSETRERLRNLPVGTRVRLGLKTKAGSRNTTVTLRDLI